MRRSEAIGARVAPTDDYHALAGGKNLIWNSIARARLILLRQKIHREMDALQFAARYGKIARLLGAARQQNRVELRHNIAHQ